MSRVFGGKTSQLLRNFWNEPVTYPAIVAIVATFGLLLLFLPHADWPHRLDAFGAAATMWGALWTALGVILTGQHHDAFARMRNQRPDYFASERERIEQQRRARAKLLPDALDEAHGGIARAPTLNEDIAEIASAILSASVFGKIGALLIIIGSLTLVARPVYETISEKVGQSSENHPERHC